MFCSTPPHSSLNLYQRRLFETFERPLLSIIRSTRRQIDGLFADELNMAFNGCLTAFVA